MAPSIACADYPQYYLPSYALPSSAALGPWPWNFDIGGGPTPVLGATGQRLNSGANFEFGGGYNFTPRAGFIIEYMDSDFSLSNSYLQSNGGAISGDADVWSFTLNPVWRFRLDGPIGAYLIGGGGYYERDLRFNSPATFHSIPFIQTVHSYDGTGGLNIGAGLTWNFHRGTKLFVEVRYHRLFTSGYATQLLPVTIGLRW
jgi:predicted porin